MSLNPSRPAWARCLATLALAGLLAACGGGGDAGTHPVVDDNAGTTSGALAGRLWHNNYALDFDDGSQIASPGGALPEHVSALATAKPTPDGSRYFTTDSPGGSDVTVVGAYELSGRKLLHQFTVAGFLRSLQPSPADPQRFMAVWSQDLLATAYAVFYDIGTDTLLDAFPLDDSALGWLPDGRFVAISPAGAISVGSVGRARQAAGQLALPAGWQVTRVAVNRQGTRLVLRLTSLLPTGTVDQVDLWVAKLDGSGLERYTVTGMTSYGLWSPDGQSIAFDVDTGSICNFGGCLGSCGLWVAPASSRNVRALPASGDAAQFRVANRNGSRQVLGCELLAWTD